MSVLDEVLCTGHGVGDVVPVLHYLEEKRTYTFAKPAECGIRGCGRFLGDRTERFSYVQS